jgi:hypothetical protein
MTKDSAFLSSTFSLTGKIVHSKAEVTQNSTEGAFGDIASVPGNSGKAFVQRVPPDFARARPLSDKPAAQLAKFPG